MRRWWLSLLAVAAACSSNGGSTKQTSSEPSRNGHGPEEAKGITLSAEARASLDLETTEVRRRATTRYIRLPGRIEPVPEGEAEVTSLIAGRVTDLYAGLGDDVRRGEVLARVTGPDLAGHVQALRAALDDVTRQRRLDDREAAVTKLRRAAERRWAAERQRLEALGVPRATVQRVARGERALESLAVRAPIRGVLVARRVAVGAPVHAGEVLMRIVQTAPLRLLAHAFERDLADLRPGQRVVVTTALTDESFETEIEAINPLVEDRRRAAKVVARLDNADGRLRPGVFARARVQVEGEVAPALPASALLTDDDGAYVVVVEEGARYVRRRVGADPSRDGVVAVPELAEGTEVVTSGAYLLASDIEQES